MNDHVLPIARHPASFLKRCLCLLVIVHSCVLLPFSCLKRSQNTSPSMDRLADKTSTLATNLQNESSLKSRTFLTFRAGPNVDEDAMKLILKMTDPRPVTVKAHQTLDQVMQLAYGDFKSQMTDLVRSANPTFPDAGFPDAETALQLPAGPYFLRDVQINVPKDGSLAFLSEILLGTEDVKSLERLNKVPKGGWTKLQEGATIILPYVSRYVTYRLREDVTAAASTTLVDVLKERAGITDAFVGSPAMIQPVGMASVAGVCTGAAATNSKWYQEALSVGSADLVHVTAGEIKSVIAFLDTGLGATISDKGPILDKRFSYWTNRQEASLDTSDDDDRDGYSNDVHGVDVVARNEQFTEPVNKKNPHLVSVPDDDCGIAINATHGTHVAGILSGSVFDGPLREAMAKRIQLLPVKVTDEEAALRDSAIQDGLKYLRLKQSQPFRVINLSFVDAKAVTNTYKDIEAMDDKLFVAAAGNTSSEYFNGEQVNLDRSDRRIFPARLGALNPNVITVAALNEAHGLAKFSYYGKETVDLAAPGESILSTVRDFDTPDDPAATGFASGTSQAAPFVSMTAALLFMMGLNDVDLVRRRLISSTDFNPGLRDYVWSSGSLNIAKALTLNDDYIQLKGSTNQPPIKGIISRPLNISAIIPGENGEPDQEATYPIEQVRKIIPEYWRDAQGKMWSALIISAEYLDKDQRPKRGLFFVRCQLNTSMVEVFKDGDQPDQTPTPVPWQDIEDIIICDPPDPFTREQRAKRIGGTTESQLKFSKVPQKDIR